MFSEYSEMNEWVWNDEWVWIIQLNMEIKQYIPINK